VTKCPNCGGTGTMKCPDCGGKGIKIRALVLTEKCAHCDKGWRKCISCNGTGKI
jgi:hypothetical protein